MRVSLLAGTTLGFLLLLAVPAKGAPVARVGSAVIDDAGGVNALAGAADVEVTPDGRHVLVSASVDDALVVLARNPITGTIALVAEYRDGEGGVDGLDGARASTTSPDDLFVYVAGSAEDEVAVFARDPATGTLAFVEVQRNGVAGVTGLDGPWELASSPDGGHLYVAARDGNAVVAFSRNPTTGRLTFVQAAVDGEGGIDGLAGCNGLAISPDGAHLYAVGENDDAVALFTRDATTGALGFVAVQMQAVNSPNGGIALSPGGEHVYVGADPDSIVVFSRDAATGSLTFVQDRSGDLGAVGLFQSIVIPEAGDRVHVASFNTGTVATWARDAATGALTFLDAISPGGSFAVLDVAQSPDGRHLYAARGDDGVYALATAVLRFVQFQQDGVASVGGLDGASGVAAAPNGLHVYVAGALDDAVALFDFDRETRAASFVESWVDGSGGIDGLDGATDVALSPDGAHVYVSGSADGAVAVFGRNAGTGALVFLEVERDGVAGVDGLAGANALALSPDGRNVYVAGFADAAVAVFSRNTANGLLDFVEARFDGPAEALLQVTEVAVSPDGANVYTTAFGSDAVTAYARDGGSGALTPVGVARDGIGGVTGLDGPNGVAVSLDGADVFAVAGASDSLVRFARSGADGSLAFVGAWFDGQDGVEGLDAPADVTVARGGRYVLTASLIGDAIAVFSRDPVSGAVAFAQVERDGELGVDGLDRANTVVVSPDGGSVFVTATDDDALAIFAPEPGGAAGWAAVAALGGASVRRRRRRPAV
jgi:6-phosphogluconolactonase (cycloisomerase 2 family)